MLHLTAPTGRRLTAAAVLGGLVVTGCSGPAAPLDVGTQSVPIALVLGQIKAVQAAPVGPLNGPTKPQDFPFYPLPSPVRGIVEQSLPPVPVGPCPDYDPLAPVLGVGRTIPGPPVTATYPYRGQVIDVYPGKTSAFVGSSSWSVSTGPADPTTGAYDVTYTVKLGAATTTRVLRTLPHDITPGSDAGSDPSDQTNPNATIATINSTLSSEGAPPLPTDMPNPAGYGLAGIYLVSQESNGVTFTPSVPLALLQLRQLNGAGDAQAAAAEAITSYGYDPVTQSAMAFKSTVTTAIDKVNACGTPLQAVQVSLTAPGTSEAAPPKPPVGPDPGAAVYAQRDVTSDPTKPQGSVVFFQDKIDFGLEYGGLIVKEESAVAPLNGVQVDTNNPPTTPTAVPQPNPDDIEGVVLGTTLQWAVKHMIFKQATFTINVKPKVPKASAS